ncbi:bifunctional sterol desaturase/short chain dehydrogenase [Synechococcus elongatus]|uniref:Bifunctional sterol desaturase/short chain dehydrogenase n=2 Tax=Synechococcus elongatus TaxID=32046 RepID=A0AAN1QND1_SYNEL|nr:bifunctional sterol desaturase/short chain dehydrogenase [Synechococcus elongatus]AZB72416.1 sterol desaturase [Synechococcus elongatus PCC 11801]QFZ92104.1 bifunctional sterol desaturase/short chain dehydrogenase [Synechococcus elongatus PCC 11802]
MAAAWTVAIGLSLLSILWVELVRDSYHTLAHYWTPLYRLHVWHHKVFRPDLTVVDPTVYRRAQWYNDVPEASVMLLCGGLWGWWVQPWLSVGHWLPFLGCAYTLIFLGGAIARGLAVPKADTFTDLTHLPGPFTEPPSTLFVNRTYHWRHHFDSQTAYFCGTFSFLDKLMGTALSLKGKTVAVTGAAGGLGQALIIELQRAGATPIALTSGSRPLPASFTDLGVRVLRWQVGQEAAIADELQRIDILLLNHGVNVLRDRCATAIEQSYEVNAFSQWRLLELFLETVTDNRAIARKEVWVNTSEAEVNPAFSPLYELSKRAIGHLITLRRLDSPIVLRKLILGPFRSDLNPYGVMSARWVARQVVALAKRDVRNIIVTINPLTYLFFPLKEASTSWYYRLFSRPTRSSRSLTFTDSSEKIHTVGNQTEQNSLR